MTDAALLLPFAAIRRFSATTQREILAFAGLGGGPALAAEAAPPLPEAPADAENDGPAGFTQGMVRRLIAHPIDPKTLAVLRTIAEGPTPTFRLKDVVAAAPGATEPGDLRGAWSGITRRARRILDDPEAALIWWEGKGVFDEEGRYTDHVGRVAALTHRSLRAAFGLPPA